MDKTKAELDAKAYILDQKENNEAEEDKKEESKAEYSSKEPNLKGAINGHEVKIYGNIKKEARIC